MKELITEICPPFLLKKLARLFPNAHSTTKKYVSYQQALTHCTKDAYEERELIEVIFKKTHRFIKESENNQIPVWETTSLGVMIVLNQIMSEGDKKSINVLDFGGACGAHYYNIRAMLDNSIKLNWHVVETPAMAVQAKELQTVELKFSSDLSEAVEGLGKIDLIHTSGTLQCVDDPLKYLRELITINANYILFNRLGLNEFDNDVVTIHSSKLSWNGIGDLPAGYTDRWIKYPFTFLSEKKFYDELSKKYKSLAKFNDKSGMYAVAGEKITGYGLFCKKLGAE